MPSPINTPVHVQRILHLFSSVHRILRIIMSRDVGVERLAKWNLFQSLNGRRKLVGHAECVVRDAQHCETVYRLDQTDLESR